MSVATCLPGETPAVWSARVIAAHPEWESPRRVKHLRVRAMETIHIAPAAKLKPLVPHCTYCGMPTRRGIACHAHSDLPALDPLFSLSALSVRAPVPERTGQEVAA